MADITIGYKGSTIAEISASGTTTLGTSGKYCEDNISIAYTKPSGSSYVKLGSQEFTINQTSTSATSIGNFSISPASDLWTSAKIIFISIRDKAGKRNGYFLGTDNLFMNQHPANGSSSDNVTNSARMLYRVDSDGNYATYVGATAYGVYVYDINNAGRVRIYARYNATNSLTINGTFVCDVYALAYPDGTPYV